VTLAELQADVYRRISQPASPDATVVTRVLAFLNEAQQEILSEPGMDALLNGSLTFASVASTPQYALPQGAAKIKTLYETTNRWKLTPRSLDWYRLHFTDPTNITGIPSDYVDLGFTGVAVQPSAATEVFADSTAAGDTGTAFLEGYRTGGYFLSKSKVMTGTTGVSFDTAITDWVFLTKFYLSAAAVGTVTLQTTGAGGTVLATIPIGQTMSRYRNIALVPTPSAAVTYTCDFDLTVPDMANAKDEPVLPVPFHRLLATGARLKEYEKSDDPRRYLLAQREFETGKRKLKYWLYSQSVGTPNLRGPGTGKPSQLGGQYGQGT
jgi:hypothetical protein